MNLETLYINIGKAIYTRKNGKALYLAFSFNTATYNKVVNLQTKYFHKNLDMWEVPYKDLSKIQFVFSEYKIITNDSKLDDIVARYKESIKAILLNKNEPIRYEFKTKPFKHQLESFEYAQKHHRFLLADDQGLGKTKQALDIAVNRKSQFKHTLIICGVNSLKWNWLEESELHTNEKAYVIGSYVNTKGRLVQGGMKKKIESLTNPIDSFFLITNMESLRNAEFLKTLEDMTTNGEIGMVVIDEIHKMKNPTSAVGKSIHKLNSYYKMALTGTPLMNNIIDLYNILKWLGDETGSLTKYKYRYCIFGGFGGREIIGYNNIEELKDRLQDIQLRRLKTEVFDLPPKIHTNKYVEMEPRQKGLYRLIQEELVKQINDIILSPNPLAKLTRLRQVTSCPAIIDEDAGYGAKLNMLLDIVDEVTTQNHKVVIFSNWTSVTDRVAKLLTHHDPVLFTGKQGEMDRNDNKHKFQNDPQCKVIIGTVGAMGTGHTLNKASYVIFIDVPWNPANKVQAEDRAHRIGTEHTVNVITLINRDSIDEQIEELLYAKKQLSDYIVDNKINNRRLFRALFNIKD